MRDSGLKVDSSSFRMWRSAPVSSAQSSSAEAIDVEAGEERSVLGKRPAASSPRFTDGPMQRYVHESESDDSAD